jgi:transposase-like protein
VKDRDRLLAFYDFPAEHGVPIRTPHPIESPFATIRPRSDRTQGCVSRATMLALQARHERREALAASAGLWVVF